LTLAFWFVDATFYSGVECESGEKVVKIDVLGIKGPKRFGALVNRHHFRLTGQVWLRFHGWSFIYADEIKIINYSGKITGCAVAPALC